MPVLASLCRLQRVPSFASLLAAALVLAAGALPAQAQDTQQAQDAQDDTTAAIGGRFERDDPQRSQLLLSPAARPIGEGEVYASSTAIFFLEAGFGLSDAVSVQAGGAVIPDGDNPFYLVTVVPRVALLNRRTGVLAEGVPLSVALDASVTATRDARDWGFNVKPRVVATYGAPEAALTAGIGTIFEEDGVRSSVVASLGGEVRVLEWLKLITETEVFFGARQRLSRVFFSNGQPRADYFEERSTLAHLMGGPRFMWDHFALETGGGARLGGAFNSGPGLLVHLRLSYRF